MATLFLFDLMWMAQTTFRPFCFIAFYPYLLLNATLLALPAVLSRRAWIQTAVLFLADIVMIANLMYCRTYFNGIPAESYLLLGNLADFTDSVSSSFRWYFSFLPVLSVCAWAASLRLLDSREAPPRPIPYLLTLLLLAFLAWASDAWRGQSLLKTVDKMRNECKENMCVLPVYQISGYVALDLLSGGDQLTPETQRDVDSWLAEHRRLVDPYYKKREATDTVPRPRNLLVILCESFESWVLEKKVEGQEITPYLNSLLNDSLTFYAPNVMTQVGHGRSIDGQLLVLTGLLPQSGSVYAYQQTGNLYLSLPKAMKADGASTFLLTGDKPQVWNQSLVARAFGIDSLLHHSSWIFKGPGGKTMKSLGDGELMSQSVDKMKNGEIWPAGEKAFILWVTHSGHHPFKLDKDLRSIGFKERYSESVADFMITTHYTDSAIATLIEYLKTRPDWKETMVVITGDHEGLSQLRDIAMAHPRSSLLVDPLPHTPLIVLNSPVPGRFYGEMGQADIYSTVLDLMGLYDYPWKGMGQSVLDPAFPAAAYSSKLGSVITTPGHEPDDTVMRHLKEAPRVSGSIIRHDMLRTR